MQWASMSCLTANHSTPAGFVGGIKEIQPLAGRTFDIGMAVSILMFVGGS